MYGGLGIEGGASSATVSQSTSPSKHGRGGTIRFLGDLFCLNVRVSRIGALASELEATWTPQRSSGRAPCKRSGHTAAALGKYLVICGGANGVRYFACEEIHLLCTVSLRWSTLSAGTDFDRMMPRLRPAIALSPSGKVLFVYGGGLLGESTSAGTPLKSDGVYVCLQAIAEETKYFL